MFRVHIFLTRFRISGGLKERFRIGLDREVQKLKTHALTAEEKEDMKQIGNVSDVIGRQLRGKDMWCVNRMFIEYSCPLFRPFACLMSLFEPSFQVRACEDWPTERRHSMVSRGGDKEAFPKALRSKAHQEL